jgi:hypothetical protein
MKKVIAAAAGLMLVGAMVGTASAAVSLSGDARARGYYQSDYDFGRTEDGVRTNEIENSFSSRVRIKFDAKAKGGAYARARVRMADSTWDGTNKTRDKGAGSNSYVDYAYIGVPMGPMVLEAGLMPVNITKFTAWDQRADMAVLKWVNDQTTVQLWYAKKAEFTDEETDFIDDNDIDVWTGAWTQKFGGDWGMTLAALYQNDETETDESGWLGTINVGGPAGPVALEGEFTAVSGDYTGSDDDGYGAFIQGGFDLGVASVTLSAGATQDGYAADDDFGFIMLGGAASITPSYMARIGGLGDTWWLYGIAGFQASENVSLKGILGWADISNVGQTFEISGSLVYKISDGANFQWDIGYMAVNAEDDSSVTEDPFGTAGTFNVSF